MCTRVLYTREKSQDNIASCVTKTQKDDEFIWKGGVYVEYSANIKVGRSKSNNTEGNILGREISRWKLLSNQSQTQ